VLQIKEYLKQKFDTDYSQYLTTPVESGHPSQPNQLLNHELLLQYIFHAEYNVEVHEN
ncbi:6738_t:CDS:2, partial [Scutellospora calospora]